MTDTFLGRHNNAVYRRWVKPICQTITLFSPPVVFFIIKMNFKTHTLLSLQYCDIALSQCNINMNFTRADSPLLPLRCFDERKQRLDLQRRQFAVQQHYFPSKIRESWHAQTRGRCDMEGKCVLMKKSAWIELLSVIASNGNMSFPHIRIIGRGRLHYRAKWELRPPNIRLSC